MPEPTTHAPKTFDELKELLKDDDKVKVAGMSSYMPISVALPRFARIRAHTTGVDVDGVLRGKFMSKNKFLSIVKSDGFGFCSVIFGWDSEYSPCRRNAALRLTPVHDKSYNSELLVSNSGNGWRDLTAKVDLSTFRRLPWERNLPFFLVNFIVPEDGSKLSADPRSLLNDVLEKGKKLGYKALSGAEFEVCLSAKKPCQGLS